MNLLAATSLFFLLLGGFKLVGILWKVISLSLAFCGLFSRVLISIILSLGFFSYLNLWIPAIPSGFPALSYLYRHLIWSFYTCISPLSTLPMVSYLLYSYNNLLTTFPSYWASMCPYLPHVPLFIFILLGSYHVTLSSYLRCCQCLKFLGGASFAVDRVFMPMLSMTYHRCRTFIVKTCTKSLNNLCFINKIVILLMF